MGSEFKYLQVTGLQISVEWGCVEIDLYHCIAICVRFPAHAMIMTVLLIPFKGTRLCFPFQPQFGYIGMNSRNEDTMVKV